MFPKGRRIYGITTFISVVVISMTIYTQKEKMITISSLWSSTEYLRINFNKTQEYSYLLYGIEIAELRNMSYSQVGDYICEH
jgi:hypothetical protein